MIKKLYVVIENAVAKFVTEIQADMFDAECSITVTDYTDGIENTLSENLILFQNQLATFSKGFTAQNEGEYSIEQLLGYPNPDELVSEILMLQNELNGTDWLELQHIRATALGIEPSMDDEQYLAWQEERQSKVERIRELRAKLDEVEQGINNLS